MPGIEIGVMLMAMLGIGGIVLAYLCTVLALSLSFLLGRLVPPSYIGLGLVPPQRGPGPRDESRAARPGPTASFPPSECTVADRPLPASTPLSHHRHPVQPARQRRHRRRGRHRGHRRHEQAVPVPEVRISRLRGDNARPAFLPPARRTAVTARFDDFPPTSRKRNARNKASELRGHALKYFNWRPRQIGSSGRGGRES